MTTETNEYYPNNEGLVNENGRLYKYAYEGVGYSNKRTLHEAMVRAFITEEANAQLDDIKEGAMIKLADLYPDDSESQLQSKLNVGFFNRTVSKVHYDLEQLASEIDKGDEIQVIAFNMPYGQVASLGHFNLTNKTLNEKGNSIIGNRITDNPLENDSLSGEREEEKSNVLSGRISTDPLA